MEGEGYTPRRTIFYSNQAAGFLSHLPQKRAEYIAQSLDDKFWRAQMACGNRVPGWRPVRTQGNSQFIIDGNGFGALVKASSNFDEPFEVLLLCRNTQDVKKAIGN